MKTKTISLVMLLAAAVSCQKNVEAPLCHAQLSGNPISFALDDDTLEGVQTKAAIADVTTANLSSIYVTATSGESSVSEKAWSYLSDSKVDMTAGRGVSSAYWPVSGNLNFYATNFSYEPRVDWPGCTILEEYGGDKADYVAGCKMGVTNGTDVSLSMNHILSRLYDLKFKVEGENTTATIKELLIYYTGKGVYTFKTNSWALAASNPPALVVTPETKTVGGEYTSLGQSTIDRTFIPGNIRIKVTYTINAPGYTKDFTKEARVLLEQGKKTSVLAVLTDDKKPINFNVTVADWASKDLTITWE